MKIDIWSDIACPWCAVGRGNLQKALAEFKGDVEIRWRSFELDSNAPSEREGDYVLRLAQKYGRTREQAAEWISQMAERGSECGVEFDFDNIRSGNTFEAHRLLHLAYEEGKQDEMKARLLKAYFQESELMSDKETLIRLAIEVGIDEAKVRAMFDEDRYSDDVREDQALARRYGISGVPFFVIDDTYALSGAQPSEVLLSALREADKNAPLQSEGESCNAEGC